MSQSNGDVAQRWVDYWAGDATRLLKGRTVFPSSDGRDLLTYGSHLSLVHAVADWPDPC
jgi:hypothetical protein